MGTLNFTFNGNCPVPFLEETVVPDTGGYVKGRYCGPSPLSPDVNCCLPCPLEEWVYSDDFIDRLGIANYISIASFVLVVFLLVSFAVLPPERSHRHYLSVGLVITVIMIELSFIIPLGTKPEECFNVITPRDMHSSASCAWTGALLSAGGMGAATWVFLRTVWMHLRICWDRELGRRFFFGSVAAGIILPAVFLTTVLAASGVSYRAGPTCFPNQENSVVSLWAWLIGLSGATTLLQFATSGYCLWVYIRSIKADEKSAASGSAAASDGRTSRSGTARPVGRLYAWRKVRHLFLLQWRGLVISMIVTIEAVYFATVFIAQDAKLATRGSNASGTSDAALRWSTCIVLNRGDKTRCFDYAEELTLGRSTVLASVILVSLVGIECFLILGRTSMFVGWLELFQGLFRRNPDPSFKVIRAKHISYPLERDSVENHTNNITLQNQAKQDTFGTIATPGTAAGEAAAHSERPRGQQPPSSPPDPPVAPLMSPDMGVLPDPAQWGSMDQIAMQSSANADGHIPRIEVHSASPDSPAPQPSSEGNWARATQALLDEKTETGRLSPSQAQDLELGLEATPAKSSKFVTGSLALNPVDEDDVSENEERHKGAKKPGPES